MVFFQEKEQYSGISVSCRGRCLGARTADQPFLHKRQLVLIGPIYGCHGHVVLHAPDSSAVIFFPHVFYYRPKQFYTDRRPGSLTNWMNTQCWQLGVAEILVPSCPQASDSLVPRTD